MLCYIDALIHIFFNPKDETNNLYMIYQLKEGFRPPEQYLGANVEKIKLKDVQVVWSTHFIDYLKSAIGNGNNSLGVDTTTLKNYGDGYRSYSLSFRKNYISQKNW